MDRQPDPQRIASIDRNGEQGGIITESMAALKSRAAPKIRSMLGGEFWSSNLACSYQLRVRQCRRHLRSRTRRYHPRRCLSWGGIFLILFLAALYAVADARSTLHRFNKASNWTIRNALSVPASQFHLNGSGQWNFLIGLLLNSWPTFKEILLRPGFGCIAPSLWTALPANGVIT